MIGPVNTPGKAGQMIIAADDKVGDLTSLSTTNKSSVVAAVNEAASTASSALTTANSASVAAVGVGNRVGQLADLATEDKTSIVNAIKFTVVGLLLNVIIDTR